MSSGSAFNSFVLSELPPSWECFGSRSAGSSNRWSHSRQSQSYSVSAFSPGVRRPICALSHSGHTVIMGIRPGRHWAISPLRRSRGTDCSPLLSGRVRQTAVYTLDNTTSRCDPHTARLRPWFVRSYNPGNRWAYSRPILRVCVQQLLWCSFACLWAIVLRFSFLRCVESVFTSMTPVIQLVGLVVGFKWCAVALGANFNHLWRLPWVRWCGCCLVSPVHSGIVHLGTTSITLTHGIQSLSPTPPGMTLWLRRTPGRCGRLS